MAITSASGTMTIKAIEQANIGGVAVTKLILKAASTGSATGTQWTPGDENGKYELTFLTGSTGGTVGDTVTMTIA